MKRLVLLAAVLALVLTAFAAVAEEEASNVGKPMPDFSFVNTEGETVTLSELLKEKDLVHVCMFATWCGPCKREFPEMEEVYERNKDRMAILALSGYPADSMEKLTQFKADMNLTFDVGSCVDTVVPEFVPITGYPTNFFIDRFGNVAYVRNGSYAAVDAYERTVNYFLSDSYTESQVLLEDARPVVNVERPDPAKLSAAANALGSDIAFECSDEEGVFPFVPMNRFGRNIAMATNLEVAESNSVMTAKVTAAEGDALAFSVGIHSNAYDGELTVAVDGEVMKDYFGDQSFVPGAIPLSAGEHEITFEYVQMRKGDTENGFVAVDEVRLLSGDAAAEALAAEDRSWMLGEGISLDLLNEGGREALPVHEGEIVPELFIVCGDDVLTFKVALSDDDNPDNAAIYSLLGEDYVKLMALPKAEDGVLFACEGAPEGDINAVVVLPDALDPDQTGLAVCYIVHCEDEIDAYLDRIYRDNGFDVDWTYVDELDENGNPVNIHERAGEDAAAEPETAEPETEETPDQAVYTVRVVDQNGDPVPEAAVGFCIEEGCRPVPCDEDGVAVYSGEPQRFHIKVIDAPDGYDYPDDTDTYIGPDSGSVTLTITKE